MMDRRFAEMDRRFAEMDRRFAEMRAEMRAGFDRGDTRLDALATDVHMLVGRQRERARATADD